MEKKRVQSDIANFTTMSCRDYKRLLTADIPLSAYESLVKHFIGELRPGSIKNGKRVAPSSKYGDRYPFGHSRVTKALAGKRSLLLYPDPDYTKSQAYFVVRLLPDSISKRVWPDRLSQLQRYAAIVDILGFPGMLISPHGKSANGWVRDGTLDLYFFVGPGYRAEWNVTSEFNIPLGQDLLDRVENLARSKVPYLDYFDPIKHPERSKHSLVVADVKEGTVVVLAGAPGKTLGEAIIKSKQAVEDQRPAPDGFVREFHTTRSGLVVEVEQVLLACGYDVRCQGTQISPSRRHPADLPFVPGSTLLHPLTLETLANKPADGVRIIFKNKFAPERIDPKSISRTPLRLPCYWSPDVNRNGVVAAMLRSLWQAGVSVDEAVDRIQKTIHSPWIAAKFGTPAALANKSLIEESMKLYEEWGDPGLVQQASLMTRLPPQKPHERYQPPAPFGLPLSDVHAILAKEMWDPEERQLMNGKKGRVRNFKKENQQFEAWLQCEWSTKCPSENMIHSLTIRTVPGLGRSLAGETVAKLKNLGVERYGEPDRYSRTCYLYQRLPWTYPADRPADEPRVASFEAGLRMIFKDEEIANIYSRSIAMRILGRPRGRPGAQRPHSRPAPAFKNHPRACRRSF